MGRQQLGRSLQEAPLAEHCLTESQLHPACCMPVAGLLGSSVWQAVARVVETSDSTLDLKRAQGMLSSLPYVRAQSLQLRKGLTCRRQASGLQRARLQGKLTTASKLESVNMAWWDSSCMKALDG